MFAQDIEDCRSGNPVVDSRPYADTNNDIPEHLFHRILYLPPGIGYPISSSEDFLLSLDMLYVHNKGLNIPLHVHPFDKATS